MQLMMSSLFCSASIAAAAAAMLRPLYAVVSRRAFERVVDQIESRPRLIMFAVLDNVLDLINEQNNSKR